MKGLRHIVIKIINVWFWNYFYLVTWMKGLRRAVLNWPLSLFVLIFTLWPEWRDYDFNSCSSNNILSPLIFTLWPEWRDYDLISSRFILRAAIKFLPCDLNEGITTHWRLSDPFSPLWFLPCDLNEGITTGRLLCTLILAVAFLPCDLNEGITTNNLLPILL